MKMIRARAIFAAAAIGCVLGVLGVPADAQAASSPNHFLVGAETGAGGTGTSPNWRLAGSCGSGVTPGRSASANFVLQGGFVAVHAAPTTGRPWLTGVHPLYVPYHGATARLHGTELALGASSAVSIDQNAVSVTGRTRDQVSITIGNRALEPGWQTVSLTNAGGTAVLPRGLGVLPVLEKNRAIQIGEPYRITYRGYPGDLVYLAIARARGPAIPLPGYHGTIQLNLGTLINFIGPFPTNSNGVFHIDAPAGNWSRPVVIQMLGGHTTPGLGLGALTNALTL